MKFREWVFLVLCFFVALSHATLTVHIQSPWREDASKDGYYLHILGGAGGGYNAMYGEGSPTITVDEGDGWFSYTWDKDLSDFQDWMTFTVSIFPNTADQNYNNNNGEQWKEFGEMKIAALFGTDKEIWLYTDVASKTFTKSFMAPGSKIVWFKSPWGNRALPQMRFGKDSVLMRFAEGDASMCGWFYGAIPPSMLADNFVQTTYFNRYMAPWLMVPSADAGNIDLAGALQIQDTIFIDGTVPNVEISFDKGTPGECFDPTRRLHIYHPWRNNTSFRDSSFYMTIDNNIMNTPTKLSDEGEFPFWYHVDFSDSLVSSAQWGSTWAWFQILRGSNEWPQHPYFSQDERMLAMDLFPTGVYEVWFYTSTKMHVKDFVYYPPEPKTVRLMSPWDNMSPSMILSDDTLKLGPISPDTCGWYQGTYYKHVDDWNVYFKQTFGMEQYGGLGTVEEGKLVDSLISLGELMAVVDTVWVYPYPVSNSAPQLDIAYPGRLGVCPTMKISALVVDWAGETFHDSIDVDFGNIYGGSEYTTVTYLDSTGTLSTNKVCGGLVKGMVQDTLVNGLPARVDSSVYPWGMCSAAHEIEKWFVPVEVAKDARGVSYTNAVCRDIDLTLDEEGFWLADITNPTDCNDPLHPGFYPIDDFEFLDSAKTLRNPKFDHDISGCNHNYSFAMKVSAQFRYVRGQYFEFRGDDDVWVYINNRLVVDIGGCHNPEEGAVDLDTMGLVEGQEYPFHIFFSERNATGSNFKMRTSINLQTQKTYLPREVPHLDGLIEYNILQLLIDESISCDVSSTTKIDTTLAQSTFVLFDGNGFLPREGKLLNPGVNYGGISVNENMAGFVIDTAAIVRARALPSGNYLLRYSLASDPSQYSELIFSVPEYPLSEIAFVDANDEAIRDIEGNIVTVLDNVPLGEYAFVTYPVRITLLFLNTILDSNVVKLTLSTSDSLVFFNKNNEQVTEIETDGTGFADFYVMGTADVVNGSFSIGGAAVGNSLTWKNINLKKPPVPYATASWMFDRNGDGIGDSLCALFNERFDDDIPDTLDWTFGDSTSHKIASVPAVMNYIWQDSMIVITADSLSNRIFTGKENDVYSGSFRYHYTHIDDESGEVVPLDMKSPVTDRIGPILMKAVIVPQSDVYSKLFLTLSEGIKFNGEEARSMFEFRVWRNGEESSAQAVISMISQRSGKAQMELLFFAAEGGVMPTVGDSVRLVPGGVFDLSGNPSHVNNAWVRITGEPRAESEVPGFVKIMPDTLPPWTYPEGIRPVSIAMGESVKDAMARDGLPGHLLRYELGELVLSDDMLSTVKVKWEVSYFTNLGQYVNSARGEIACNDSTVFNLDPSLPKNCRDNPGNIYFEWNARSKNGRLVGTGAYISKFYYKVISGAQALTDKDETYTLGIKRLKP